MDGPEKAANFIHVPYGEGFLGVAIRYNKGVSGASLTCIVA